MFGGAISFGSGITRVQLDGMPAWLLKAADNQSASTVAGDSASPDAEGQVQTTDPSARISEDGSDASSDRLLPESPHEGEIHQRVANEPAPPKNGERSHHAGI